MELITLTSLEQLDEFRDDWSFILEENVNTNPFIEFNWVYKWWEILGEESKIEIIVVLDHKKVVAFLPFLYNKKGFVYTYNFIGFGHANYMDFISYEHNLEYVLEFAIDYIIRARKHVVFYLHGLLESAFSHRKLEVYLRKKKLGYSTHRVITPYINLDKLQMEEYIKKRKKLHRLDRREKRIRENGDVQVLIKGPEEMETIHKIHDKRWKKKHDTSGFTNLREKVFFESLALLQEGVLKTEIDGLYMDDRMIAFNYGFECRGRYISYVLGFDDDFEVFSPGRILEKEKILQCGRRELNIFDLSIGYETYKFDWNTDLDYTKKVIFSSKTLLAQINRMFLTTKESIISRIKIHQSLVMFKRNKIGKILYVLKNLFNKNEYKDVWQAIVNFVQPRWNSLFEWKQYCIYEIDRKKVSEFVGSQDFMRLHITDAINNETIKYHMKAICTKVYGAFKGYYPRNLLSFKDIFWINEKVIRIDDVSYLKDLKKSSVFIENWTMSNLRDICSFVHKQSKANKIFICVKAKSTKEIAAIEEVGFTLNQLIVKRTVFGYSIVPTSNGSVLPNLKS